MDILEQELENTPSLDDKQISMWAHLIGIASCMSSFLGIIGVLIFYVTTKDRSTFVKQHLTKALNFQITYFIVSTLISVIIFLFFAGSIIRKTNVGSTSVLFSMGFGVIFVLVLAGINLFCCIKGAIVANKGKIWHNPFTINLIK